MIDSLLFLPDVDLTAGVVDPRGTPDGGTLDAPAEDEALDEVEALDAQVAAALAATRDGHAHAAAAAWREASAAFARSAGIRDALVAAGVAGPLVAARAWSDVAAVRVVAGDLDGARAALTRVRSATRTAGELPPDVRAAFAELESAIDPAAAAPIVEAVVELEAAPIAGGLLWLDTTDETIEVLPAPVEAGTTTAVGVSPATPPTRSTDAPAVRIAAVDAAVALASGSPDERAPGGLAARLRRLLKR